MSCSATLLYSESFLGETGEITPSYTPVSTGLFRLSVGGKFVTASGAGSGLDVFPNWSNSGEIVYPANPGFTIDAGPSAITDFGASWTIYGQSGVPISVEFNVDGAAIDHYDAYMTIEQLD